VSTTPAATLAVVDLGSNSFRLEIGRVEGDQIYRLDTWRETLRFGAGLDPQGRIKTSAMKAALRCLARFRERLAGLHPSAVRAVATNTFRVAKNAREFLPQAEHALGFPIDVIGGHEEARLIYLGVAHELPRSLEPRLVVDIGGGSTEFIIGAGFEPQLTESLYMGCVSWSLRYFPDGKIDKAGLRSAELAARQELSGIVREYRALGWQEAVGSSGTARAIEEILRENGYAESGITHDGLQRLRALLLRHEHADPRRIAGLRENRVAVLPGGVAILCAVFEALGIEAMAVSEGALRHGVLYDLLGRVQHTDPREATVAQFMRRYHVDAAQAERVRSVALEIYDALAATPHADEREDHASRLTLEWAARLAEIGLSIAHAQYHKHSAYVLSHADMPGFSRMEQQRLARIVLAHRGKLGKVQDAGIEGSDWMLVFALRVATLLARSRTDVPVPLLRAGMDDAGFALDFSQTWLDENPLSADALESEAGHWKAIGMKLAIAALSDKKVSALSRG
jgi:exopolyphosphatase/guanosine-5'-triphosphate,3'-diphosphate pyrophosphatase